MPPSFMLPHAFAPRRWAPWLLLSSSACLSQSYEIAAPELQRIVALPPDERGDHLRVTQQTAFGNDTSDVPSDLDDTSWSLFLASRWSEERRHGQHTSANEDDGSDEADEESAEAALAVALVTLTAAATAALTIGVTEGVRFDGWVRAPGDQPVLLVGDRGARRWTRLESLTPDGIRGIQRAVLPDYAGHLERQERHPLDRQGFVYQLELGGEAPPFQAGDVAFSARGAIGYMPSQRYGLLVGAAFASAEADEPRPRSSDTRLSFDHRVFFQAEAWPLTSGPWHLGPYVELGLAWARTDDAIGTRSSEGWMLGAGAALQLEWSTRLGMTLRAGVASLPSAELAANGRRLAPALTLGFSIY